MSKKLGDIDYTEEEYLYLGAQYEECKQNYLTEVNIIDVVQKELEERPDENQDNRY